MLKKIAFILVIVFISSLVFSQSSQSGAPIQREIPQTPTPQYPEACDPEMDPTCIDRQSQPETGGYGIDRSQQQRQGYPNARNAQERTGRASEERQTPTEQIEEGRARNPNERAARMTPEPPTEFQRMIADSVGSLLPIFGQDLFNRSSSTFAPIDRGAAPDSYVLGVGDELVVRVWGQLNFETHVTVGRDGQIYLPKVGAVSVAGVKYGNVSDYLKQQVGRVFKNFDLSVSVGKIKSIEVFVVGQVRFPGKYTISSLSSLVNAVFVSGGPNAHGSMRRIQLSRGGKPLVVFDLYDLLMKGDTSKDVLLASGDVISIPAVGPLVAIAGSVNIPAIFELNGKESVQEAISYAGGVTDMADGKQVKLERIQNHVSRTVMDVSFDQYGSFDVQGGDLIRVASIIPRFDNAVTLRGNVANPGRYPFREGMKISDLIPTPDVLLTRNYWLGQSSAVRGCATEYLGANRLPQNSVGEQDSLRTQTSEDRNYGDNRNLQQQQQQPEQTRVPRSDNRNYRLDCTQQSISEGTIRNDVKLSAPEINWDYAVVQRLNPTDLSTMLLPFSPAAAILDHKDSDNIVLKPGDVVTIFSQRDVAVPQDRQSKLVRLEGEVKAPGFYRVAPGESLQEVIGKAGGITSGAYLFGTELTRESARKQQQRTLAETARLMESSTSQPAIRNAEDAQRAEAQTNLQRELVRRIRETQATGRIVLQVAPTSSSITELPRLALEDGDRVLIPARPQTVSVIGAVFQQSSFVYSEGGRVKDYLRLAGNGTHNADLKHVMVVRADGAVLSGNSLWDGGVKNLPVLAGDSIIIPTKLETGVFSRNLRDWTQVASQLALTGASLAVVTR